MTKSLEGRWVKQRRAAVALGLLLFTQCSQQGPAPAERAETSRQSAALSVNQWPLETLTATNSIALEDRATLVGDAVVTKQATGAVLAFNAELALGFDAVLTGSAKSDTLVLKDRAIITGTARYNDVTSTGTIQGGGTTPLSLPLFSIPALPTATPGSQDITLTSSQQQTRAAGTYRDVLLNSGNSGTPTRLTLSGGLYHFKSLTVLNDAGVQCSAACEIRVQARGAFGDRSFLKPQSGVAGLGVGNVELLIGGANGAAGPAGWPAALEVNNDGQLRAYTFAPNGTARLGHRTVLQGKVVARDVLVGFDSDAEGLQLPLISTQPVDVTVRENQPASFSVAVSSPAGVTYRWQRGGVDITGTAGAGATYTLAHAPVSADGAQFRVKVTNAAGTVTSNAAILHVIPCAVNDVTCDNFDDDCNGVNDEDFGPKCNLEGGTAVLHCGGGNVFAVPCTNGNACDGAEVCQNASCQDGPDPVVDDGNPCTADSCIHPGGVQHELLPAGTDCGDGNDCNGIDHCTAAGVCETRDPLLSIDPCIVDICDASTGLEWATAPAPEGTLCDDGDVSNDPDFCDGAGQCVTGSPRPFVACVKQVGANRLAAAFGYENQGSATTILSGADNFLNPNPLEPAAFETFREGHVERAFWAVFPGDSTITWTVLGSSATASVNSPVCPPATASSAPVDTRDRGERPGELRSAYGKPPARRVLGAQFRSRGFDPVDPGSATATQQLNAMGAPDRLPPSIEYIVPRPSGTRVRIVSDRIRPGDEDCALEAFTDLRARVFVDDVARPLVDLNQDGVELAELLFDQESPSVNIRVDLIEVDSVVGCGADDLDIHFGNRPFPLGDSSNRIYEQVCGSGSQTDEFCWHVETSPLPSPQLPGARLCFEWSTSFVDEGLGESVLGRGAFTAAGTPSMDQHYPARFAEYQLSLQGRYGSLGLGLHYNDDGSVAQCSGVDCGNARFLDADGCVPQHLLPSYLLATPSNLQFPTLHARLRTRLGDFYNIQYADLTPSDGVDDEMYQVVQFDHLPTNEWGLQVYNGPVGPVLTFGAPPVAVSSTQEQSPASNVAAILGSMLSHPDNGHPGTLLEVQLGVGPTDCQVGDECTSDAECGGIATCQQIHRCDGGPICEPSEAGSLCSPGSSCELERRCDRCPLRCERTGEPCVTFHDCPEPSQGCAPSTDPADCSLSDLCNVDSDCAPKCEPPNGDCVTDADCAEDGRCRTVGMACQVTGVTCIPSLDGSNCPVGTGPCVPKRQCEVCTEPNPGSCESTSSQRCVHCTTGSDALEDMRIGPATAAVDATTCTSHFINPATLEYDDDCPGAQRCLQEDGTQCPIGQTCICHYADQSQWKGTVLHEAGHQLQFFSSGSLSNGYVFECTAEGGCTGVEDPASDQLFDPESVDQMCGCEHVTSANRLHCLQSVEKFGAALSEGFGHFNAARLMNFRDDPSTGVAISNGVFPYYKEVLGAELIGAVDCDSLPGLCKDTLFTFRDNRAPANPLGPDPRRIALPPVAISLNSAVKWRDTFCPSDLLEGNEIRAYATEHDFLQFFWSTYSEGTRLNLADIFSIFRSTCNARYCVPGDASCRLCDGGTDSVRWAPIEATEVDGVDNPDDPMDNDVAVGTVSLRTGAALYFGADAAALDRFDDAAVDHGITPDSIP